MLCKVTAFVAAGLTLTQAAPPAIPGFSLTWSDDFEGSTDSLPSPADWIIDTGAGYAGGPNHWGTGEIQNYTANPANLNLTGDSVLRITPLRDGNNQWTSARIESQRSDFQAMAGGKMRISARIKMPNVTGDAAAGYWPAFWSLGDKGRGKYQDWPMAGEYDIMENVNGINQVWGVFHCGTAPGGPCKEMSGLGEALPCPGSPCQGNWHVYNIEVDRRSKPEKLSWSVDDITYHTITENDVGGDTWVQAVQHEHMVVLNVAIGGAFPNGNKGSATPGPGTVPGAPLYADWIAVYNSV